MKIILYFLYTLIVLNVAVWILSPWFFFLMMWKLDIFILLIFAPLLAREWLYEKQRPRR